MDLLCKLYEVFLVFSKNALLRELLWLEQKFSEKCNSFCLTYRHIYFSEKPLIRSQGCRFAYGRCGQASTNIVGEPCVFTGSGFGTFGSYHELKSKSEEGRRPARYGGIKQSRIRLSVY